MENEVVLFKAITTEEVIAELELQSKERFEGVYLDMDNPPERKIAKDSAKLIKDLRKKLDRARIDLAKDHKVKVEAEFKLLDARLAKANAPFDTLIDAYNEKRKEILAEEKAKADAIATAEEKERDHEFALLIYDQVEREMAQAEQDRIDRDKAIKLQADIDAEERIKSKLAHQEQTRINAENAKLANEAHVLSVLTSTKEFIMSFGIDEPSARKITLAIKNKQSNTLTINY